MQNETIVLYTEDKELMREVRRALLDNGFSEDESWNDRHCGGEEMYYLYVWYDNEIQIHNHNASGFNLHHLSRTDLLTMFLLG